jgi:hypothetical protein
MDKEQLLKFVFMGGGGRPELMKTILRVTTGSSVEDGVLR